MDIELGAGTDVGTDKGTDTGTGTGRTVDVSHNQVNRKRTKPRDTIQPACNY